MLRLEGLEERQLLSINPLQWPANLDSSPMGGITELMASLSELAGPTTADSGPETALRPAGISMVSSCGTGNTASVGEAERSVVTLYSYGDALVMESDPDANYGDHYQLMTIHSDAQANVATYLKFDLRAWPLGPIPRNSTIERVELELALWPSGGERPPVLLSSCTDHWSEMGITWNNRPTDLSSIGSISSESDWWTWSSDDFPALKDFVSECVNSPDPLSGGSFVLTADTDASPAGRIFYASEYSPDQQTPLVPHLRVEFSPPANVPPTISGLPDRVLGDDSQSLSANRAEGTGHSDAVPRLGAEAESAGSYMLSTDWGGKMADAEKAPPDDTDNTPPGTGDDFMCWAAAASNVLEWTGWGLDPTETGAGFFNADEIFGHFQDHWTDEGGWAGCAWSWWFDGIEQPVEGLQNDSTIDEGGGGGFYPSRSFADHYNLVEEPANMMEVVDAELQAGHGVVLSIYVEDVRAHAITCWGFSFDSAHPDYYTGIWVTDSDDGKKSLEPPNQLRHYDLQQRDGNWYLENYVERGEWQIWKVESLARKDTNDLWAYAYDYETLDAGLTFSLVGTPNPDLGVSIRENRYLEFDPTPGWSGEVDVTIQVSDGQHANQDTFHVTVQAVPSQPVVSIVKEQDAAEPSTNGLFKVQRTGDLSDRLIVDYQVTGTADNGEDYTLLSGEVEIFARQDFAYIPVEVIDDSDVEGTETVVVTLQPEAAKYQIDPEHGSATVDIIDDDELPVVSIVKEQDAAEPSTNGLFKVQRTGDLSDRLIVDYQVTGTADNGEDYTLLSGEVEIFARQDFAYIPVEVIDDSDVEGTETVVVTLQPEAAKYQIDPAKDSGIVNIKDDDFGQTFQIAQLTPAPSAFVVGFNRAIDPAVLSLYDVESGAFGEADVTLVGNAVGLVAGSLVIDDDGDELTFIATGGPLPADTYTVTMRSAPDGIKDAVNGQLLDGEYTGSFPTGDSIPGGDFVCTFTIDRPVIYATDFSSDPDWTTNSSDRFHWDPSDGTYYANPMNVNDGGHYTYEEVNYQGGDLRLQWDVMPNSVEYATELPFGMFDSSNEIEFPGGQWFRAGFHTEDRGRTTFLHWVKGADHGGAYAVTPQWTPNTWYTIAVEYDASANTLDADFVVRDTGQLLTSIHLENAGPFDAKMNRIGCSKLVDYHSYQVPGAEAWGKFDNVSLSANVVLSAPPVVVSLPDFARGPGQPVDVPADRTAAAGLPIRLSESTGVESVDMTIEYDPDLLTVTDVRLGLDAPAGSMVTANLRTPGMVRLCFCFAPGYEPSGPAEIVTLSANVPTTAPYRAVHVLDVTGVEINERQLPVTADDAIHVVAYFGDTEGNQSFDPAAGAPPYSDGDAELVTRVAVGLDSSFAAYAAVDPLIIGDISGNGKLSGLDARRILQKVADIHVPEIPPLPGSGIPRLPGSAGSNGSVGTVGQEFGPYIVTRVLSLPPGGIGGLAFADGYLYSVESYDGNIRRLDPTTGEVLKSYSVPGHSLHDNLPFDGPKGLAWDGSSFYLATSVPNWLRQLRLGEPSGVTVLSRPSLPGPPGGLTYAEGYLHYAEYLGDICRVDLTTGTLVDTIPSPSDYIYGLTYDGQHLLAAYGPGGVDEGTIWAISPKSGAVVDSWVVPGVHGIRGLTYDPVTHTFYVATFSGIIVAQANFPLTVSTLVDENDGDYSKGDLSLREALDLAAQRSGDDVISFDAGITGGIITLDQRLGQLRSDSDVSIQGPGRDQLTIDGSQDSRVFWVGEGAAVVLTGLTITSGRDTHGGGIYNSGELTIIDCSIANNLATYGGGIYNTGTMTISNTRVSGNEADGYREHVYSCDPSRFGEGGGIYNVGTASITDCTIRGNEAYERGGGISNQSGSLTLTRSEISDNEARGGLWFHPCVYMGPHHRWDSWPSGDGGGIYSAGTATIMECTIVGNSAGRHGGGVFNGNRSRAGEQ